MDPGVPAELFLQRTPWQFFFGGAWGQGLEGLEALSIIVGKWNVEPLKPPAFKEQWPMYAFSDDSMLVRFHSGQVPERLGSTTQILCLTNVVFWCLITRNCRFGDKDLDARAKG